MIIQLDGSYLEGGGQILRTAVGLSTLTGKACRINNIRAGRSEAGLGHQHMKSIEACGSICNAYIEGLKIGSTEIVLEPELLEYKDLEIDIGTAGSVPLLLQALLIPLIQTEKPIHIRIKGGTHVQWSPTADYFNHIYCRYMDMMGISIQFRTIRHGFYPRGGGEVSVTINPSKQILPLDLKQRNGVQRINAWSVASENLKHPKVAERQLEGAQSVLNLENRELNYASAYSAGSALLLGAEFSNCILGASQLGKRGVPAEKVGIETAQHLRKLLSTSATVDEHLADQLLPYMSMAKGDSTIIAPFITDHVRTNMWVIQNFLDVEFKITETQNGSRIDCHPIPFQ